MAKEKSTMQVGKLIIEPKGKTGLILKMGKNSCEVEYKELWSAVFVLGDATRQADMVPVRKTEMMVFARKHTVEATHDIKKGERIQVHCEVNIPETLVESIAEENGAKVIRPSVPEAELSPYQDIPQEEKEL